MPPRYEFEEFFATSEATSSAKSNLVLYPKVNEILESCADRASRFARESKPLHRVVPLNNAPFMLAISLIFVRLVLSILIFLEFQNTRLFLSRVRHLLISLT